MKLKTEQEVLELIGKDTALKFECFMDNVIDYKTVVPVLVNGNYVNYLISLFYKDLDSFLNYETLDGLSRFRIFEVIEVYQTENQLETLYHKTFNN